MQDKMVSVILPVYNAEKYIEECIYSIINQNYSNLELFVIDDGSTDGSGAICDKYVEYDSRVKVFHFNNRGLAVARNVGLDMLDLITLEESILDSLIRMIGLNRICTKTFWMPRKELALMLQNVGLSGNIQIIDPF